MYIQLVVTMEAKNKLQINSKSRPRSLQSRNSLQKCTTIGDLNKHISRLTAALQTHDTNTELVVEKYLKDNGLQVNMEEEDFGYGKLLIDYKLPKTTQLRTVSNREKEAKEMKMFAGVFSARSVLQRSNQDPFSTVNSMVWKKQSIKETEKSKKMKPMLVELHVFPGYESNELTPLPPPLTARDILEIVTRAQLDLKKKPGFKKVFQSLILSRTSEAVLQDTFWWYFLEKYQPDKQIQELLFNRIAHNYVKLLFTCSEMKYKETFFKRYPHLVSQAVYAIFCHAFPTSYRQFDGKFLDDLINVTHLWIVGTRPLPRSWEKWELAMLEPSNMRKNEEIKKDASKGSFLNFGLELTEERLSKQNSGIMFSKRPLPTIIEDKSKCALSLQATRRRSFAQRPLQRESVNSDTSHTVNRGLEQAADSSSVTSYQTPSHSITRIASRAAATTGDKQMKSRESCAVGRGPEFSRAVFDVHGVSPLVQQFLKMQRLATDAGTSVLLKRTEIKQLPPLSAPTYKELVRETLKQAQKGMMDFKRRNEEESRLRTKFVMEQKKFREDYKRRESELLAKHKEVKRISDLLVLEITKDGDEQSSGKAAAAIASAMGIAGTSRS